MCHAKHLAKDSVSGRTPRHPCSSVHLYVSDHKQTYTMPVTFTVAEHGARNWTKANVESNDALFKQSCAREAGNIQDLIQSSLSPRDFRKRHITPSPNGLIWTVFEAYSKHHHLVLRPEDIWFAILSQLSFHINAHAEDLRSYFVSHAGRKELVVLYDGRMEDADFGALASRMAELIQEHVRDPRLRDWVMPCFSTTTDTDRVVAAVLMMGSTQQYFSYRCEQECGIPSVTLLGEHADWEDMLLRVDYLAELGAEPAVFAGLLKPVLRGFVDSFSERLSAESLQFWGRIVHRNSMDSGDDYLSGWITAFGYWNENGRAQPIRNDVGRDEEEGEDRVGCLLGDVRYPCISTEAVPVGFTSVPVVVESDGKLFQTKMVAGSIGIEAKRSDGKKIGKDGANGVERTESSEGEAQEGSPGLDTLQPLTGWFMYKLKPEE